ncbi:hypothetical protein FKM82_003958, partial [Ascaphus truei]
VLYLFLSIVAFSFFFFYAFVYKQSCIFCRPIQSKNIIPEVVLSKGKGIIFMETTDRMELPSLVLCALESAARVYHDRPVAFFMKGLTNISSQDDINRIRQSFPTLSSFNNIYFFPLRMQDLFNNTPLHPWYMKVDPKLEKYWTHVSSDGCRYAFIWKYGGIYMDTDVISIRPIMDENFVAAEFSQISGSAVFGMSPRNYFTWNCLKNFVQNYKGEVWGYQGPSLLTRVLKELCDLPKFQAAEDIKCESISFLNPQRFYPISYPSWQKYFQVWKTWPTFSSSYGLHLWNFMNRAGHKTVVPGSNTLVDHLYQQYCPTTYRALLRNEITHH